MIMLSKNHSVVILTDSFPNHKIWLSSFQDYKFCSPGHPHFKSFNCYPHSLTTKPSDPLQEKSVASQNIHAGSSHSLPADDAAFLKFVLFSSGFSSSEDDPSFSSVFSVSVRVSVSFLGSGTMSFLALKYSSWRGEEEGEGREERGRGKRETRGERRRGGVNSEEGGKGGGERGREERRKRGGGEKRLRLIIYHIGFILKIWASHDYHTQLSLCS